MKKNLTLLLLLPGFACFAQKVNLALNLQKDSTYYLKSNYALQINQNIQGQHVDIGTTITGDIAHKVLAIHDSVYNMEVTYRSMHMLMNMMGTAIDFSSNDKSDVKADPTGMGGMMGKMLKGLMNKPFLMDISNTGHVLSIKNLDGLFEGMFVELPQLTVEQKAQFKAQMEKSFGETSLKNSFQMAFPAFPAKKVAVNDKWTGSSVVQSTVTARVNTTYTLTQVTGNACLVTGEGEFIQEKNASPTVVNGMTTRITGLTGKITTNYVFDKHTGWILSSKGTETMNATVNVKTPAGEDVTYPMEMTGNFTVSP